MNSQSRIALCSLIPALILLACATEPQFADDGSDNADLIARVENDAALDPGLIQVQPLSGPEVDHLLASAALADQQGRAELAQTLVDEALELAPDNPEVWQRHAELSLKYGQLDSAIDAAQRSFQLGPQVGELCNRNWLTIAEAQRELGRSEAAQDARRQSESCPVRLRKRL